MNEDYFPADKLSLREFINAIPHGVAVLARDGTVAEMNHYLEAFTGHAATEVRGTLVDQIIRSNIGMHGRFFREAAGEKRCNWEGNIIDANRKKLPVRITLSPVNNEAGAMSFFLLLIEDSSASQLTAEQEKKGVAGVSGIIGHSPGIQKILDLLPILAHTDTTLLITGETGTGKDLLAETIHRVSPRVKGPFVKVNCGALPEALLESELFGHTRGAFTGANSDKPGMLRLAEGGTIFLTEIGDLPFALQVKLLTVLDDKEFFPLGSSKKIKVDIRLITATHHDLQQRVQEGRFRQDLYFRLNVLRAHLPPLRERGADTKLLAEHFLRKFSRTLEKNIKGFNREAESRFGQYPFPGNVRELSNVVEYAANMCQEEIINVTHLPDYLQSAPVRNPGNRKAKPGRNEREQSAGTQGPTGTGDNEQVPNWSQFEKKRIFEALRKSDGNRTHASSLLGWSRSRLLRKIKHYGLE